MKRIIILGAGGLGRQVLAQLQVDYGHGIDWVIGGFLDERGPESGRGVALLSVARVSGELRRRA